jgi:AraC-like DNA-binding protein
MLAQRVSCHIVLRTGQNAGVTAGPAAGFRIFARPMPASTLFTWHEHLEHQLAWAATGVLTVLTQGATWVLPPTRALWIPAGTRHETRAASAAAMRSVFVPLGLSPVNWAVPTPVAATPLLGELIGYLGGELTGWQRGHAESVLSDLLTPVPVTSFDVRFPDDPRAVEVARALRENPGDQRTVAQWGRVVGASERTLARAFVAGTGLPFGRWRTLLRLQVALPLLAAGDPVAVVARSVGYETPSAFTVAFRRETGLTPAAYFTRQAF